MRRWLLFALGLATAVAVVAQGALLNLGATRPAHTSVHARLDALLQLEQAQALRTAKLLGDWAVPEEAGAAIGGLLELVQTYSADAADLSVWDALAGLSAKSHAQAAAGVRHGEPEPPRELLHWCRLANGAYGSLLIFGWMEEGTLGEWGSAVKAQTLAATPDELDLLDEHALLDHNPGLAASSVLYACWQPHDGVPAHFVVLDHAMRAVVLGVRGTLSTRDVVTDLMAEPVHFLGGSAHRGMLASARRLAADPGLLAAVDRALSQFRHYRLVLVGHSLGAGVVSLLTVLWQRSGRLPVHHAYAFAAPAVVSRGLVDAAGGNITAVAMWDDMIPRLSVGSARALVHELTPAEERRPADEQRALLHPLGRVVVIDPCVLRCGERTHTECDPLAPNLCVRVGERLPPCETPLSAVRAGDYGGELIVSPTMFLNHFPDQYERALASCSVHPQRPALR